MKFQYAPGAAFAAALLLASPAARAAPAGDAQPAPASPANPPAAAPDASPNDTGSHDPEVIQANGLIRANKFAEAKQLMTAHLAKNPNDKDAQAVLGVADAYSGDFNGAMAAFDAAGNIPAAFRPAAAKAYSDATVEAFKTHSVVKEVELSTMALAFEESVDTLYLQGTAFGNVPNYPAAIADLQKAKAMAASAAKPDPATVNAIDASLVTSLILGGQADQGLALARDFQKRNPTSDRLDAVLAAYYIQQANGAMRSGDRAQATASLDAGAAAAPSRAVDLYMRAAGLWSVGQPLDWEKVGAEARKALVVNAADPYANYVVGVAETNLGRRDAAMPFLNRANANVRGNPRLQSDIDAALKKASEPAPTPTSSGAPPAAPRKTP
ncbi:MAG: tetratricopeptide repeat protein [Caulobacterales bacterium]